MRYLDKLLESLETSGPKTKSKPNNFKLLKKLVRRGQDADEAGNKLDSKYLSKNTKTSRDSTNDRKQDTRLTRLSATAKEAEKSFTQADKLVPKVHLKGGGKGDGKPRGKLRLAHKAYQQIGDIIAEARKELNYKQLTQRAIDADKKYKAATKKYDTLPKGESEEKALLQKRRERALAVKRGRLAGAAKKMDFIKSHTSYQQIGEILAEITYSKPDASILTARQRIANAKKLDAASSAAMKSRERDNRPHTQEQWEDKLKAKKILGDPETRANADKPTTREQSP